MNTETEYLTYLTSEEYKQHQLDKLITTNRQIKTLEQQQKALLHSLVDTEKAERIYECVSAVHTGVLEGVFYKVDDAIVGVLSGEDAIFMLTHKHSRFGKGAYIFKAHMSHEIQKRLTRSKYMNISGVKKQRTPAQHIYYMIKARLDSEKDTRLDKMQQQIDDMSKQVSLLVVTQQDVMSKVDMTQTSVEEVMAIVADVEERVALIEHIIPDKRKQQLYILLTSDNKPTMMEASKLLEISLSTANRWYRELKSKGVM